MPTLSVIIPAYDEAARLPSFMMRLETHLNQALCNEYEIIVIDDGSRDSLCQSLERVRAHESRVQLVRHELNQGKGAAIRTGIRSANGRLMLFCDADGACAMHHEADLRGAIIKGADIAIGSRMIGKDRQKTERVWFRDWPGRTFAWMTRNWLGLNVMDTQCGFKMLRAEVAFRLCAICRENGYLFDVELLYWAQKLGYRIAEVPVSWRDVPGSKVRVFRDGAKMLCGLWRLRRALGRTGHEKHDENLNIDEVIPVKTPLIHLPCGKG